MWIAGLILRLAWGESGPDIHCPGHNRGKAARTALHHYGVTYSRPKKSPAGGVTLRGMVPTTGCIGGIGGREVIAPLSGCPVAGKPNGVMSSRMMVMLDAPSKYAAGLKLMPLSALLMSLIVPGNPRVDCRTRDRSPRIRSQAGGRGQAQVASSGKEVGMNHPVVRSKTWTEDFICVHVSHADTIGVGIVEDKGVTCRHYLRKGRGGANSGSREEILSSPHHTRELVVDVGRVKDRLVVHGSDNHGNQVVGNDSTRPVAVVYGDVNLVGCPGYDVTERVGVAIGKALESSQNRVDIRLSGKGVEGGGRSGRIFNGPAGSLGIVLRYGYGTCPQATQKD